MKLKPKRLTHLVYKINDLNRRVYPDEIDYAIQILEEASSKSRKDQGKDPEPSYIVINTDEPYIEEIIEVLKKHGQWNGWSVIEEVKE